jgi:hypothetical protein
MLVFLINMENMPDSSVLFPHHAPSAPGNIGSFNTGEGRVCKKAVEHNM